MLEMSLIKQEQLPLVSYSLMSWIPLQSKEVDIQVMLEELATELSTSCLLRWMVLVPRRISSSLEQPTDLKSWTRLFFDL